MKKSTKYISQEDIDIMQNMNDFQKKLSFGQIYKINRMLVTFFQESQKILCQKHKDAFEEIENNAVTNLCIKVYMAYVTNDYGKWEEVEKIVEKHAKEIQKEMPLMNFKNIIESEEEMKNMLHGSFLIFMMNSDKNADLAQNYIEDFIKFAIKHLSVMMSLFIKETRGIKEK